MRSDEQSAATGGDVPAIAGPMMQAVVQDAYGTADVLRLASIAAPEVGEGEVLLRVRAAGLDRGTWHLMTGRPYLIRLVSGIRTPRNPVVGRDVAGTVLAIGPGATRFAVGDEVYGFSKGSFAEYAVALEAKLARKPANISFEQAAVIPVSGLTALQALTDVGQVTAGQQVLVIGASGGVGSYAVQLAKAFGAEVTGVCSTAKQDLVRSLGADHVIDYTRADFADGGHRYDLILDLGGNPKLSRLRRALAPAGTLVIAGGEEGGSVAGGIDRQLRGMVLSLFVGQRLTTMICKENAADLERLTDLVEAGKVTPRIDRTYALDQAAEAMRQLEAGRVAGKVAISI